jgi:hypothetical protein
VRSPSACAAARRSLTGFRLVFEAGEGVGVYGHAAYGAEELLERLDNAAIRNGLKVQPRAAVKGHFSKDRLDIDLDKQTVT